MCSTNLRREGRCRNFKKFLGTPIFSQVLGCYFIYIFSVLAAVALARASFVIWTSRVAFMQLKYQYSGINNFITDKPFIYNMSLLFAIIQYFPDQSTMSRRCTPMRNETSLGRYWISSTHQS